VGVLKVNILEALRIVVLETGAVGSPVLLADKRGVDDVEPVGGGKVVPATIDGIQQGPFELLCEPSDQREMSSRLNEFVSTGFAWGSMIQKYLLLYRNLLSGLRP
jgi:glycosyltransferase involved in cell wall biosynthesis